MFENKYTVTKTNCWQWINSVYPKGYPRIKRHGRTFLVHRLMYEKYIGPIPTGMFVCHKCDNRICINPNHLFIGSARDNYYDAKNKGRTKPPPDTKLENNPSAKLNLTEVCWIRNNLHFNNKQLAKMFNVTHQCISKIRRNINWVQ